MTFPSTEAPATSSDADLLRETERARLRALVNADIAQARQFHAPDF